MYFNALKTFLRKKISSLTWQCIKICSEENDLLKLFEKQSHRQNYVHLLNTIRLKGQGVVFAGRIEIINPDYLIIGNNVYVSDNAWLNSSGGITIGDNVYISKNAVIDTVYPHDNIKKLPFDKCVVHRPVIIDRNVFIGMGVSICPGVHIGESAVIAHGTVVSTDVPAYSVVGQAKQRVIETTPTACQKSTNSEKFSNGTLGTNLLNNVKRDKTGLEKGKDLFFVVSTGRAGSTSISNILSRHKEIECLHEANRQLIRISTEYCHGEITIEATEKQLRAVYCSTGVFKPDGLVGESNLKAGNLIKILSKLLPQARFIWIARDGRDFVSSAINRGWFSGTTEELTKRHQWSQYRVSGLDAKQVSEKEWISMDPFERSCWYWDFWNNTIRSQLFKLDYDRYYFGRMEEFSRIIPEILNFLEVDKKELLITRDNVAEKEVEQKYNLWDYQQRIVFEKRCGKTMAELGYSK